MGGKIQIFEIFLEFNLISAKSSYYYRKLLQTEVIRN